VWKILTKAGIEPAPRRTGPTWMQFLRSQAEAIIVTDFFAIDLLSGAQVYCLAVLEHATRRIHVLGVTDHPTAAWMVRAPRANAVLERWIGSYRREILDRTLVWNQAHLRSVLAEYKDDYNRHRPHRTVRQASPITKFPEPANLDQFKVRLRDRLGGIIHKYSQFAWHGRGVRHA
jgi:putative transposase